MPILNGWELVIDADAVLRGQGADPAKIRERSPHLIEAAERALAEGLPLLQPQAIYERFTIDTLRHEKLLLKEGGSLSGALIGQHLGSATEVIVMLCTIGDEIGKRASEVINQEMVHGLALDGVGSAAVEALANETCRRFEVEAEAAGLQTSIPLSPGMLGWEVGLGQPQIFELLDADSIGVTLTEYGIMIPRKSLSMVLGVGAEMGIVGRTCDFCAMKDTCRYQDHYQHDAA